MAEMFVSKLCMVCKTSIKNNDAIYVANVNLSEADNTDIRVNRKNKYRIGFNAKKDTKGIIHKHCWEHIFENFKEKKEIKILHPRNRLKSVDSQVEDMPK